MTDPTSIMSLLRELRPLGAVLDDPHVRFVTVLATGEWTYEKLGRFRTGEGTFDREELAEEVARIDGRALSSGWSIRAYPGAHGSTLLLERRPGSVVDRIPEEVLQTLKQRARRDGVTVIAGPPSVDTSNVLIWATRHLPDEPILLVSETPPEELPASNIILVDPPSTPREHRSLQRLMRRMQNVAWDRVSGLEDVNTLLGGGHARRRWLTLDSDDTVTTLKRFKAWQRMGYEAPTDVLLQLTSSVIGRAEVRDLLVFEQGEWREVFSSDGSRLEEVQALERTTRRDAGTRPGIERDASTRLSPESDADVSALRAGIRKRPGQPTEDFDNPMTIPVPEEGGDLEEASSEIHESTTSKLDGDSSTALLNELDGFEEDEDPTSSGEIDLQGFLARREAPGPSDRKAKSDGMLPEETRQYRRLPGEKTGESEPPDELIPGIDLNAENTGKYNLENLKITRVDDVEEEELDELRRIRKEQLETSEAELEELPSLELDPEELFIEEDDEEWVEIDTQQRGHDDELVKEWGEAPTYDDIIDDESLSDADAFAAIAEDVTNKVLLSDLAPEQQPAEPEAVETAGESTISEQPAVRIDREMEERTSPSVVVEDLSLLEEVEEESEDTAEFSLGDKIRIIRRRLKNEEA